MPIKDKKGLLLQLIGLITFIFLFFIIWKDRFSFLEILERASPVLFLNIFFFSFLTIFLSGLGYVLVARIFNIHTPFFNTLFIAISTIVINNLMAFGGIAGFFPKNNAF